MLLLHILNESKVPIHLLHFNHKWRKEESDEVVTWIEVHCEKTQMPYSIGKAKTKGVTSEGQARNERWEFLLKEARRHNLHSIWTAHHADDLVETFLLQLCRGAGPDGLAGLIKERFRGGVKIIRPLLEFSRKELEVIARDQKVAWKEDKTNKSLDFFRNRIRHQLLPMMSQMSGRESAPLILRTAKLISDENDYWQKLIPNELPTKVFIKDIKHKHPAYQKRYIRSWLHSQNIRAPSYDQIEAVRLLMTHQKPSKVNLSKSRYCRRRAGYLFIE